jgi:hypothetical protein
MFQRGRLIRESEWMRVYECEYKSQKGMHFESKFLTDRIQVPAGSIIKRWPDLSLEERNEFANAFADKPELTHEDERILNFLMEAGEPITWMTIAPLLPRHRDRERVLRFVLEKIGGIQHHNANFFQALELMADKRALPALRADYDDYREALGTGLGSVSPPDYTDYLYCCAALWRISGSVEYKQVIEEALKSQDNSVRTTAEMLLSKP